MLDLRKFMVCLYNVNLWARKIRCPWQRTHEGVMKRQDLTLLILGLADGASYSPVQIQKAVFVASENLPHLIDVGPKYDFQPHNYGPFDRAVFDDIRVANAEGMVDISRSPWGRWSEYRITLDAMESVQKLQATVQPDNLNYLKQVSEWVRGLSFSQLVSAIYRDYPGMRENSIFVD